MKKQLHDNT